MHYYSLLFTGDKVQKIGQFPSYTSAEIKEYIDSKEWCGCAGYKIEGKLAGFVKQIIGSYSGVVGLPLFETRNLLIGAGVY